MASNSNPHIVDTWVLEIEKELRESELEDPQNSHAVCICHVPKSLKSSAKPEVFIPQFVSLGPYHHSRSGLTMTHALKLAEAKRVLKDFLRDNEDAVRQLAVGLKRKVSDIRACYHADKNFTCDDEFLFIMTVDGLFLSSLLHSVANPEGNSSILTGKHGLPLVNAAGVELTKDAIIRDAFMLENQIPTDVLKPIMAVTGKEIQSPEKVDKDLGSSSTMLNFCKALCPLVHFETLSKNPEAHAHLLDLVYHLIVPEHKPEDEQAKQAATEPEPENKQDARKSPHENDDPENPSTCIDILVYLFIFCYVLVYILLLLPLICFKLLRYLLGLLAKLAALCSPLVDHLHNSVANSDSSVLKDFAPLVGQIQGTGKLCQPDSTKSDMDARPPVMIPSVTELHKAGIHFRPAKGGISSIEFHEGSGTLKLPKMRLDVNSEVIMRNLVAYELLTKSDRLLFTRFVELMRAIIDTAEDVHLLVRENIIESQLKDEEVAELFNGMSKSIRPTKAPELDEEIKKVNGYFDSSQKLGRVMTKYVYSSWRFLTLVAALVLLALTALQTYCSVYSCSRNFRFGEAA